MTFNLPLSVIIVTAMTVKPVELNGKFILLRVVHLPRVEYWEKYSKKILRCPSNFICIPDFLFVF